MEMHEKGRGRGRSFYGARRKCHFTARVTSPFYTDGETEAQKRHSCKVSLTDVGMGLRGSASFQETTHLRAKLKEKGGQEGGWWQKAGKEVKGKREGARPGLTSESKDTAGGGEGGERQAAPGSQP